MKLKNTTIFSKKYTIWLLYLLVSFGFSANLNAQDLNETQFIKIGLLIPTKNNIEAKLAAELAIQKINEKGGIDGKQIQLFTRSLEGAWGTGSKEAVDLIFNEKVIAIIGAVNGRNAHLIEQACAKTQTIFMNTWATDPTLSQAYVPWYFSCVPTDDQQAEALINEITKKRKLNKIITLTESNYDAEKSLKSFLEILKNEGTTEITQFSYKNSSTNYRSLLDSIQKANAECIVFFGNPSTSQPILKQLQQLNSKKPIFSSLAIFNENNSENLKDNNLNISTVNWKGANYFTFKNEFQKKYNTLPNATAVYTFDGVNLIIEAIKKGGSNSESIQENLLNINYEGVTGIIQFNNKGRRLGIIEFSEI